MIASYLRVLLSAPPHPLQAQIEQKTDVISLNYLELKILLTFALILIQTAARLFNFFLAQTGRGLHFSPQLSAVVGRGGEPQCSALVPNAHVADAAIEPAANAMSCTQRPRHILQHPV